MYRRYEVQRGMPKAINTKSIPQKKPMPEDNKVAAAKKEQPEKKNEKSTKKSKGFITRLIPQSLYDPDTKKVLGLFSAEDLLLVALILLMLEEDDETDNSILVYALIYILISEYIDLPL